jgi:hypothetical protein
VLGPAEHVPDCPPLPRDLGPARRACRGLNYILGGGSKVDDLVGLSPSTHGTSQPLAAPLGLTCPACAQQAAGSPFITQLNAGDETPGSADYMNVVTRYTRS